MNAMPIFIASSYGVELGVISAVSYAQAIKRARKLFGRCEVIAVGNVPMDRKGRHADSRTHGRAPYDTKGFDARRNALVEAYKADNA